MIKEESQVLLTFYERGRLASKGANAGSKKEIRKMMAFAGAIDPKTGEFSKILDTDWYISNKKPFPKKYYWSKSKYEEPTYQKVCRKLRWTWEQVKELLNTPVLVNDKQWKKLSDEKKITMHANQCLLPGEYEVTVEFIS